MNNSGLDLSKNPAIDFRPVYLSRCPDIPASDNLAVKICYFLPEHLLSVGIPSFFQSKFLEIRESRWLRFQFVALLAFYLILFLKVQVNILGFHLY